MTSPFNEADGVALAKKAFRAGKIVGALVGSDDVPGSRDRLPYHQQMADAQDNCVPCKLCGGRAIITDAGDGAGYYVRCENSRNFRKSEGCMLGERRLGGWAYNVMEWWNRLHGAAARKMVSGDLFHRSEHRFPEDCWGGGRTDCRRCGAYLNSFYDDEHGCRGPAWMRAVSGDDWDGGREE